MSRYNDPNSSHWRVIKQWWYNYLIVDPFLIWWKELEVTRHGPWKGETHLLKKTQSRKESWNAISKYWTLCICCGHSPRYWLWNRLQNRLNLCTLGPGLEEGTDIKQAIKWKICQWGQVLQGNIKEDRNKENNGRVLFKIIGQGIF